MSGGAAAVKLLPYGLVNTSTSDPQYTSHGSYRPSALDSFAPTMQGSRERAMRLLGASKALLVDQKASRLRKMKQTVMTSARLMNEQCRQGGFRYHAAMVTLTYAAGATWGKRDVSSFLHCVRQWHARRKLKMHYTWVAEMQLRGEVHYHVVFWVPSGWTLPKVDDVGWWKHGDSNVKGCKSGVAYLTKYASKGMTGPDFPRGVRIHGNGGLLQEGKRLLRWHKAPVEAREMLGPLADIRPAKGGRVDRSTAQFWASPWRVIYVWGRLHMFRIESSTEGVLA